MSGGPPIQQQRLQGPPPGYTGYPPEGYPNGPRMQEPNHPPVPRGGQENHYPQSPRQHDVPFPNGQPNNRVPPQQTSPYKQLPVISRVGQSDDAGYRESPPPYKQQTGGPNIPGPRGVQSEDVGYRDSPPPPPPPPTSTHPLYQPPQRNDNR